MASLIGILSKYGFKDILARMNIKSVDSDSTESAPASSLSVYVRIRMVLEELGPTFVKLGQALSNREDLLPKALTLELQNLQDKVEQSNIDVRSILEDNFGTDYHLHFSDINPQAIASASIAQVYQATLKTGEKVVLKVKRPHIDPVIEDDLLIIKDFVALLSTYSELADSLNLEQAVNTFEKSLLLELSFVNERENIERFARDHKNNPNVYVPKVYPQLSNNEVLCMEYIEGAKITDSLFQQQHHLNPNELADKGLQLYLNQILDSGFFHADPHAGNIMVMADGRIVFIDLGAMGHIYHKDQELLEDVVLNMMTQNVSKLVAILKKMAVRIDIKDEKKLHNDLHSILNLVNTSNLEDININIIVNKFKDILFENRIVMPDYFTLLARGLVLIESVGRTLNPEMNLIKSIEPYVTQIIKKRLNPKYLLNKSISTIGDFGQDIQNIPLELRQIVEQLHAGKLSFKNNIPELEKTNSILKSGFQDIVIALILSANLIATALIFTSDSGVKWLGFPIIGLAGLAFSGVLTVFLLLKMMKRS